MKVVCENDEGCWLQRDEVEGVVARMFGGVVRRSWCLDSGFRWKPRRGFVVCEVVKVEGGSGGR